VNDTLSFLENRGLVAFNQDRSTVFATPIISLVRMNNIVREVRFLNTLALSEIDLASAQAIAVMEKLRLERKIPQDFDQLSQLGLGASSGEIELAIHYRNAEFVSLPSMIHLVDRNGDYASSANFNLAEIQKQGVTFPDGCRVVAADELSFLDQAASSRQSYDLVAA